MRQRLIACGEAELIASLCDKNEPMQTCRYLDTISCFNCNKEKLCGNLSLIYCHKYLTV